MSANSGESNKEIETDFEDIVTKLMSVDGDSGMLTINNSSIVYIDNNT